MSVRTPLLPYVVFLLTILLFPACSPASAPPVLSLPDGGKIELKTKKTYQKQVLRDLSIITDFDNASIRRLAFSAPISALDGESALTIDYYMGRVTPEIGIPDYIELVLFGDKNAILRIVKLPTFTGREISFQIKLEKDKPVHSFQIQYEGDPTAFALTGLEVGHFKKRVSISPDSIFIAEGYSLDVGDDKNGSNTSHIDCTFPPSAAVKLGFEIAGKTEYGSISGAVNLLLSSGFEEAEYLLTCPPGRTEYFVYEAECGLAPEAIFLSLQDNVFVSASIEVIEPPSLTAPLDPITLDLGGLLRYNDDFWRNPEYEIFSWSVLPSILIFDTRDYRVQAAFFKRLAFFVEKPGYTGTLLANNDLEGKHGWNAHDYRADDLSSFFTKAREADFPLNPEEEILFDLLVENGVIIESNDKILPGGGGVLSVSRESFDLLRKLLLTHEACHGVFFTDHRFREGVEAVWKGLAGEEQEFWRQYLRWSGYDVDKEYLLVNEFQAYLLQQRLIEVDYYFKERARSKIENGYPEKLSDFDYITAKYPDTFYRSTEKLDKLLFSLYGLRAGDLSSSKKKK
jgi:hypothetical protein